MHCRNILNIIHNHVFYYKADNNPASVQMQNYVIFHVKHFNCVEMGSGDLRLRCGDIEYTFAVWRNSFGKDAYVEDDNYKVLPRYFRKEYFNVL